ncbi:MFS transporter [Cryptosporangium aurantiacum]|uniref:Drug resistance transporter, EmrB/QacA subfamily n=1 Tax=Cryptosporangium aurantiacum TaxID=134849 RepID=A0A1M7RG14_9ACTN|nr:MFS transporter [Cryptosporangium aurantiacum]SHN45091.1 drug resistance transporter, EmrB/QacA subfamily [Cryptosporangium aurantiacum]
MAGDSRRWVGLVGMCTAAGLVWLAFADFGVAVPTISRDIGGSLTALQWANNAFSLVTGALVLATGRLGDLYGRRRMLQAGLVAFGVTALLAAFPSGVAGLIAGRALMGIGAALILPATLALIPAMFPRAQQPTAFGAWMAVAWVGQAAGPAVGGLLTDTIGWRSIFWVNAPLAVVALALVGYGTAESTDRAVPRRLDVSGILTSALAAFCLLYGCTEGQELGFTHPLVLALFAATAVLIVVFVVRENRARFPLVDLALFRVRSFDGALVANTVMNMVFAGTTFLLTLHLQDVEGYSAVAAGLLLLPSTVTILAVNPLGGRLSRRRGARLPVVAGLLTIGVGTVIVGLIGRDYSYALLASGLVVVGAGLGLLSIPLSDTAVAGPPERLAGTAAGLFKMTSMLGGALGVAVLMAVSQAFRPDDAAEGAPEAAFRQVEAIGIGRAILAAGVFTLFAAVVVRLMWRPAGAEASTADTTAGSLRADEATPSAGGDRG